jgi:hypothetical protein
MFRQLGRQLGFAILGRILRRTRASRQQHRWGQEARSASSNGEATAQEIERSFSRNAATARDKHGPATEIFDRRLPRYRRFSPVFDETFRPYRIGMDLLEIGPPSGRQFQDRKAPRSFRTVLNVI